MMHSMRNIAKSNWTLKETQQKRRPRISYCGFAKHSNDNQPIKLCKSDKNNLFFNGLANCGSYWRCPVCAIKISESKKELLTDLLKSHIGLNHSVGFLTLTVRHSPNESLNVVLDKLLNNFRSFQNVRFFSRNKKHVNYLGMVKTLEITYSKAGGWHPHLHVLFFYNNENIRKISMFQKWFVKKWAKYKDNNGTYEAQNQQIITNYIDVANYATKYDITSEMTKGNIKGSKGLTPFTALAKISLGDYSNMSEKFILKQVYSVYVEHTQGRAFVFISQGIRKQYSDIIQEKDKSDEQIVNDVKIDEVLLKISIEIWKQIAINDLQPLVLNKFSEHGLTGVFNLLTFYKAFNGLDVELDKDDIPLLTFSYCELPSDFYRKKDLPFEYSYYTIN